MAMMFVMCNDDDPVPGDDDDDVEEDVYDVWWGWSLPQVSHSLVVPQFVMWEHSGELVSVIIITLIIIGICIIDIWTVLSYYHCVIVIIEKNSKIVFYDFSWTSETKYYRSPDDR